MYVLKNREGHMERINREIARTLVLERLTLGAKLSSLHETLTEITQQADIYKEVITREQLLTLIKECSLYIYIYIEEALETLHPDTEEYMDLLTHIEGLHYKGKL
ncbi:hypothetical protein Grass_241 [Bacillus phage Grass]|uniref:Uncharacterized protein n=1 Tax=Bacillus phage Grass TaxID=1406785 RepID=U5PUU0_BPGRA|nr:hypothetical protein Grass_241 [Bacillus phage Grass]AGY47506.1 hypothetical protein Grass_241 [Bacillus phage Grass]